MGAGWDHMAPEGNPAAGPVPFISKCRGLLPHMVPRRSVELPLLEAAQGRAVSRGWAVSPRGFEWATPPPALEVCEDFCLQGPPPRLFRVILREGWGGPRVGEGQRRQSCVCVREVYSSGTGLKRVSSFLRTIKAMSTHQSPRPTELDLSRGGAVSNVRRDTLSLMP